MSSTGSKTSPRPPKVLAVFGPTASGKSELILKLFSAAGRALYGLPPAEAVSADSMQVYRGMDIGTAKPGPAEREALPLHLIDIRDPSEQYDAGEFCRDAERLIVEISARGALPVVSGGTGFYLKTLLCGPPEAPPSDGATREAVRADLEKLGPGALMAELSAHDPVSAARIHPNDHYRLTRALEVLRASGRPLSSFSRETRAGALFDALLIGLERPREELYRRIDARVEAMFAAGLAREAARLRAEGHGFCEPGMKAIGYREFEALERGAGLEAVEAEIKADSRRYAKRQLLYMRSLPGAEWHSPDDAALIAERIRRWLAA